jgi:3-oxoacyl-[acyl-carrier-protein] synthase III
MQEELLNTGMLKKGQKIVMMVPESARFTYAYAHLTVV